MPVNLLFILHLPPPKHGAAIVGRQIKQSKIINNKYNIKYVNLSTSNNIKEIGKKNIQKIISIIIICSNIVHNMKCYKPHRVYFTLTAKGLGFYRDFILILLIKSFGGKMIYHLHNKGVADRQSYRIDNIMYEYVFRNAEVVILSKYLYKDIEKYVKRSKVYICPNGIGDNNKALEKESLNTNKKNKGTIQLLFLSNLYETKGIRILLEACHILKKNNIIFNCKIAGAEGDISKNELLQMILDYGLNTKVQYEGYAGKCEKKKLFRTSDIFVFPTLRETYGLVVLEAMREKLPIIATNEGGLPDIVVDGQTGYLVEKRDSKQLAERIQELIFDDELRLKMGSNSLKRYVNKYTLDKFENTFVTILNKIVR